MASKDRDGHDLAHGCCRVESIKCRIKIRNIDMKAFFGMTLLVAAVIGLCACERKSAGEKVGERIDEVVDNIKDGEPPLKEKGPMEKLGESIDQSLEDGDKK